MSRSIWTKSNQKLNKLLLNNIFLFIITIKYIVIKINNEQNYISYARNNKDYQWHKSVLTYFNILQFLFSLSYRHECIIEHTINI